MRKCFLTTILLMCFSSSVIGESDTLTDRIDDLDRRVQLIDNSQLNYKIEKDLLKETYSINYERINLLITAVLGIIAVLGYFGIRDISKIKEKFETELTTLRNLKAEFEQKSNEFSVEKAKIDEEIKTIFQQNLVQNQKIKLIELKEKCLSLFEGKNWSMSLEFVNAALEIDKSDSICLQTKGRILMRFKEFQDALLVYRKAFELYPDDTDIKFNLAESLFFAGNIDEAESLIAKDAKLFEAKDSGQLLKFFTLIKLYFDQNLEGLQTIAKSFVDHSSLNERKAANGVWDYEDAKFFADSLEENELKTALRYLIAYSAGEIDGKNLLTGLKLPIPKAPLDEQDEA
jgi:tetratricopeptide (TPR) repeat protein